MNKGDIILVKNYIGKYEEFINVGFHNGDNAFSRVDNNSNEMLFINDYELEELISKGHIIDTKEE